MGTSACGKASIDLEKLAETAVLQTAASLSQGGQQTAPSPLTQTPTPTLTPQELSDLTQTLAQLDENPTPTAMQAEATSEQTGAIAFVSDRDGDLEVYITDPAGSNPFRFSNNPGDDYAPVWSPEDAVLAYVSSRPGGLGLYLESVDHSIITRRSGALASSIWDQPQVLSDDRLAWSPSGMIAYSSSRCAVNCGDPPCPDIPHTFSGATEEEARRNMEKAFEKHTRCITDWWDGQIYTVDIYGVDASGLGESYLTFDENVPIFDPAFSLKGDQFAAVISIIGNAGMDGDIYLFNSGGASKMPLVVGPTIDHSPSLSPDGKWVAFVSSRDGNSEIYLVGSNGENLERLTQNPAEDWMPTWSPDGTVIAFTSNRDGDHEIYTLDLGNKTLRNGSNHPANDFSPSWTALVEAVDITPGTPPAGTELVYETRFDDFQTWFTYKVSGNLGDAYSLNPNTGELVVIMNEANGTVYALFGKESNIADIELQASIETMADSNRNSFDLICRASNRGWYEFGLDSGGLWLIRKYDHTINEYIELGKGGSFLINMGANQNSMKASCSGRELILWINGEMVAAVEDSQFKEGYFGIGLTTYDVGNAHVVVSSFLASTP
jgi:dipeptidyl aminopeptidase/acylaminoacyl peptidase